MRDEDDWGEHSHDPDGVDPHDSIGWIPPTERAWRHPSERAGATESPTSPPTGDLTPAEGQPGRSHGVTLRTSRGALVPASIGVVLLVLLVLAATITLADSDAANVVGAPSTTLAPITGPPATDAGVSLVPTEAWTTKVAEVTRSIEPSLVLLERPGLSGIGVVVGNGGIVVTTDPRFTDDSPTRAVLADGSVLATSLIGRDRTTGITVLQVQDDLPVAAVSSVSPTAGSMAMAVSLVARPGAAPRPIVSEGPVGGLADAPATTDDSTLPSAHPSADVNHATWATSTVEAPVADDGLGSPLVAANGKVLGMMTGTEGGATSYLPAALVVGITDQLLSTGVVAHGDLGLRVASLALEHAGVSVTAVTPGGAASACGVHLGDILLQVDGEPISSPAALASALYADPPGDQVTIVFLDQGEQMTATAALTEPS